MEYKPLENAMGNNYGRRGVKPGDVVYIVSICDGQLYLGGRMTVGKVVSRREAMKILRTTNLWLARKAIIAKRGLGTPLNTHRRLAFGISRKLRCISPKGIEKRLFFLPRTQRLDAQATRGFREITADSAAILDRVIAITDRKSPLITVTEKMTGPIKPKPFAIKGLVVRTPFAQQIADGSKRIEYRSTRTNYRGWVAIIASRRKDSGDDAGRVVCLVRIIDCVENGRRDFHWKLANPIPIKQRVEIFGQLGLFDVPRRLPAAVRVLAKSS
jgi:ASCH domain-containing protein